LQTGILQRSAWHDPVRAPLQGHNSFRLMHLLPEGQQQLLMQLQPEN
jgi:hypothetical protein